MRSVAPGDVKNVRERLCVSLQANEGTNSGERPPSKMYPASTLSDSFCIPKITLHCVLQRIRCDTPPVQATSESPRKYNELFYGVEKRRRADGDGRL